MSTKDIWKNPIIGEELKCQCEIGNLHDPLAVAVVKQMDGHDIIVEHVSCRISASFNNILNSVKFSASFPSPLFPHSDCCYVSAQDTKINTNRCPYSVKV